MTKCARCPSTTEIRPFGPKRSNICADCAQADPETEAIAKMYAIEDSQRKQAEIQKKLETVMPGVVVIPVPLGLLQALRELTNDHEASFAPCDCPRCMAARKAETQHAN